MNEKRTKSMAAAAAVLALALAIAGFAGSAADEADAVWTDVTVEASGSWSDTKVYGEEIGSLTYKIINHLGSDIASAEVSISGTGFTATIN